jgi:septal ring factor EnvC (AmiA/AmiB activator)
MPQGLTMGLRTAGPASAAVVALVIAIALVPGSLLATVSSSETAATYGLEPELERLQAVREQLARRRALQDDLERRVGALDRELEALATRRVEISAARRNERREAAAIERRLDHLVPRVLAQTAAVRARREQVGRLLADLASSSRRVELDQTVRARLLAISPVMLRRLHDAEARLATIERQPDPALARQQEIERRAPALAAEARRLQRQREQQERQRQATLEQLEAVKAEVAGLATEQRALSRQLLTNEAAHVAHAGPRADEPALSGSALQAALGESAVDAAVKGELRSGAGFAAAARQPVAPQLVAMAPEALDLPHALTGAQLVVPALPPPPAKPLDVARPGDLIAAPAALGNEPVATALGDEPLATALDVVFRESTPRAQRGSRVAAARLQPVQPPLMPVPEEAVNPFSDRAGGDVQRALTIPAAPGQAVAAPEAGLVVFAGAFRGYGKLLIIEHQREYHTLLWGFSELGVKKGDRVRPGQIVGVMADGAERSPELHVELRRNGRPVNPLPWLAASSNKVRG